LGKRHLGAPWAPGAHFATASKATINRQVYYLAADGNLMRSKKDRPPPDFRYFSQPKK